LGAEVTVPIERSRGLLDAITTLVIVVTCGVLLWANRNQIWRPSPPGVGAVVSLDGAAVKGDPDAPVALVLFTDYQCPYCRRLEQETLPGLIRDYVEPGKARLTVRHLPLTAIHPVAFGAAAAAVCGGAEGKFWELHDRFFEQQDLTDAKVADLVRSVGLDPDEAEFKACVEGAGGTQVNQDRETARALGLSGTPAVAVGRVRGDGAIVATAVIRGARPAGEFAEAIDDALQLDRPWVTWIAASVALVGTVVAAVFVRRSRRLRAAPGASEIPQRQIPDRFPTAGGVG
jgi:protein-disulfide isomerase